MCQIKYPSKRGQSRSIALRKPWRRPGQPVPQSRSPPGIVYRAFGYRDSSISSAHSGQVEEGGGDSAENKPAAEPRAASSGRRHLGTHVTRPGGTIAATRSVHARSDGAATPQYCPKSRRSDFRSPSGRSLSDCSPTEERQWFDPIQRSTAPNLVGACAVSGSSGCGYDLGDQNKWRKRNGR